MDLLFTYKQDKKDRSDLLSTCDLNLELNNDILIYRSSFYSEYMRHGNKRTLFFQHQLHLNLLNGEFSTSYKLVFQKDWFHGLK